MRASLVGWVPANGTNRWCRLTAERRYLVDEGRSAGQCSEAQRICSADQGWKMGGAEALSWRGVAQSAAGGESETAPPSWAAPDRKQRFTYHLVPTLRSQPSYKPHPAGRSIACTVEFLGALVGSWPGPLDNPGLLAVPLRSAGGANTSFGDTTSAVLIQA